MGNRAEQAFHGVLLGFFITPCVVVDLIIRHLLPFGRTEPQAVIDLHLNNLFCFS